MKNSRILTDGYPKKMYVSNNLGKGTIMEVHGYIKDAEYSYIVFYPNDDLHIFKYAKPVPTRDIKDGVKVGDTICYTDTSVGKTVIGICGKVVFVQGDSGIILSRTLEGLIELGYTIKEDD